MSDSFATPWTEAHQFPLSMGFLRQEYWMRLHFLLQGIFLTQGLNLYLLYWQANSLPLSHLKSLPIHNQHILPLRIFLWILQETIVVCSKQRFSSVHFSCSVMSDSLPPHGLQHARPPCPSPTPRVHSNTCPLSWWCHPTISSSFVPFSSHHQFKFVLSQVDTQEYHIFSRKWQPTAVLLPGKSHGWRSLAGYSPWGQRVGRDWVTSLSFFGKWRFVFRIYKVFTDIYSRWYT